METATLDLAAGAIREFPKNVIHSQLGTQDIKVLKNISLFGANNSGKSNFFKAFMVMRYWVLNSTNDNISALKIPVQPFSLNKLTENEPTTLEVYFVINQVGFRYGFVADKERIHQEWLFTTSKRKEENVFIRNGSDYQIDKRFQADLKQKLKVLIEFTKPKALFLSVLGKFNIQFGQKIIDWFYCNKLYTDNSIDRNIDLTAALIKDEKYRATIYDIIKKSDLGFSTIKEELDERLARFKDKEAAFYAIHDEELKEYKLKTRHQRFDEHFQPVDHLYFELLEQESAGAQKFVSLLGPIVKSLVDGEIIWIDELDSRLHTHLVNLIVHLFNASPLNRNHCQAILTTHNIQVFKKLRRDQMVLLNKDLFGASSMSSVHGREKPIRSDAIIDKEYLNDQLGGVPRINKQLLLDFDPDEL
ncbi:AAA family ATPase [Mucilaginibacter myungsuensis]|uniref:ATP-binding protein n=1 Tax=Mucilaginibacter myungsuensis TaxID=649104 RepID=A0A929L4C0_9SPHI|nr:ATP-binding protein [Mucilaginibacter myungsuensis]MBE9663780.1 ATP-binding protein [Mucilaginibacter myungsuensis]MDN3598505.1 ATP-binding protein [Mucilaginibacter myungsuensis]